MSEGCNWGKEGRRMVIRERQEGEGKEQGAKWKTKEK